jgi:hypothetical protein
VPTNIFGEKRWARRKGAFAHPTRAALAQFVEEATKRLFIAFDGAEIPRWTIEDLVKRLMERRLNF